MLVAPPEEGARWQNKRCCRVFWANFDSPDSSDSLFGPDACSVWLEAKAIGHALEQPAVVCNRRDAILGA